MISLIFFETQKTCCCVRAPALVGPKQAAYAFLTIKNVPVETAINWFWSP
ncbi:hypothetical protein SAMN05428981_103467 [Bacillus sp. OV194]|nr:hypothetical protein SAMN05428981_103467 [Bacillus sp. OV194]